MKGRTPSSGRPLDASCRDHSRGFTLIEMVLALAMATMLIVAVMQLVVIIGHDYRTMPERAADAAWLDEMARLVEQDMAGALTLDIDADGATRLTTFGALDPVTLQRTHRPAEVIYRIQTASGGRPTLVREQVLLGREPRGRPWVELLAVGVQSFDLERMVIKYKDKSASARPRRFGKGPTAQPRPRSDPAPQVATMVKLRCLVQAGVADAPVSYEWTFVQP